jgi:HlyD family secretion protein
MVDIARPDLAIARRRRRLTLGGVAALGLVAVSFAVSRLQPAAPVVERASVWIETVKRGPMVRDVRGTGTLVPEDLRWIPAEVEGRVDRIRLHPGARVEPDTVILDLSNPELDRLVRDAVLQLRSAETQLANRRVELESALLAMQSTVATLESDAREARLDAEAEAQLHAKGLTSAIALRTKRARADNLEARLGLERQRLEMQRRAVAPQLAISQTEVDRQRATLGLKQAQLAGLQVRAGVRGVLQQIAVELGARVGPGTNLARVVDPARLKAELKVPETQTKDIQLGQRAAIDTRNGVVAGRVARIDPAAASGTVTVDVVLEGDLPRGARPDLNVEGTIEIERLADVVWMGRPVIGEEGASIRLFRLDATGHAVRVPVTLGRMAVNQVEIRAGLAPGDQVILSDMSRWDAVDRVRIK